MTRVTTSEKVLVVGPLPSPLNGMTVMTAYAIEALRHLDVAHEHFDTSDHRGAGNVGRLDPRNVWLALAHGVSFFRKLHRSRPRLIYLPIAQSSLGVLRDSQFFAAARLYRVPVVVHFHGAAFHEFYEGAGRIMRWVVRQCIRGTKRVIVLGESLTGVFGDLVDSKDIVVIPNGIPDCPPVATEGYTPGRLRIVFLSNLSEGKGYKDVLDAAQLVLRQHPKCEFVLAGDWARPEEATLVARWLARSGVADRIRFHRPVVGLRKHELLLSADVFVFPPRQLEGQGLVLLEAMSHNLPVITTPRGGIRDVVIGEQTAILVPPGNAQALGEAICSLIENPKRRVEMGRAGRALFIERFGKAEFQSRLGSVLARDAMSGARAVGPSAGSAY